MKIAVCYQSGEIFQHFGHTEQFKIYDVSNGQVKATQIVETNGQGHGALGALLHTLGVDALICGGIGPGAQMALSSYGIRFCAGVSGDADTAVDALLNGSLTYGSAANCGHHGQGHSCGEHSCHEV